jgi:hypothetical protein
MDTLLLMGLASHIITMSFFSPGSTVFFDRVFRVIIARRQQSYLPTLIA